MAIEPDFGYADTVWFSGDFPSWQEALRNATGYDDPRILAKVLAATLKVERGHAAYERDSVIFTEAEYSVPLLACLLYVASKSGGKLRVMDIGGSLGSSYRQNRRFLDHLDELHWSVVEQPHFVEAAARHLAGPIPDFYSSIGACLASTRPNLALLSSVLPYVAEPYELLAAVLQSAIDFAIVDRTPFFVENLADRITVEHVPASIYEASYPAWFFNVEKFRAFVGESPFEIFEEFDSWEKWQVDGDPAQSKCILLVRGGRTGIAK
jgi:putative methyltransferase (TIGR04325 family)